MARITEKMLDNKAQFLSEITGQRFEIQYQYGQQFLARMCESGGIDFSSPSLSPANLMNWINAYIEGFRAGQRYNKFQS